MRLALSAVVVLLLNSYLAHGAGCSGNLKVTSQQDLDGIKGCSTYTGSITVDKSSASKLSFDGISMVDGEITVSNNDDLTHLVFPKLQAVGALVLDRNKALSTLDFSSLTTVRTLSISVHPALSAIVFPAGLLQADKITVSDTTATRIDGLKMSKITDVIIDNNLYLKSMALPNVSQVANAIKVSANSPALALDLSTLQNVQQAAFNNLAAINLQKLSKATGDISFLSNSFSSLEMPNVTEIGGTLTVFNNMQLSKLSVPQLQRLGGALSVGNNTQLASIDAFPFLEEVDGSIDLTGSFDQVQFPKLGDVRGGLNVQTSSNQFGCDGMNQLKNGVVKGNSFVCKANVARPKSNISGGSSGGSDSSNDGDRNRVMLTTACFGASGLALLLAL